jgi:hypothetical protein
MGFLALFEFYTMRKIKSAERPKTNFLPFLVILGSNLIKS